MPLLRCRDLHGSRGNVCALGLRCHLDGRCTCCLHRRGVGLCRTNRALSSTKALLKRRQPDCANPRQDQQTYMGAVSRTLAPRSELATSRNASRAVGIPNYSVRRADGCELSPARVARGHVGGRARRFAVPRLTPHRDGANGRSGATAVQISAISGHSIEATIRILETYIPRNAAMAAAAVKLQERADRKRAKRNQPTV